MERFHSLDSLRGLAALTVFLHHILLVFPVVESQNLNPFLSNIYYSPVHLLWAGHEAVMLFFILSGFVLFLPFIRKGYFEYNSYVIKRFFRIYIPYLFAILIGMGFSFFISSGEIQEFSNWFNSVWKKPFEIEQIIPHLTFFITNYDNSAFNPVIWSLIHEMRLSLIFPIIAYIIIKFNWKFNLLLGLALQVIGGLAYSITDNDYFLTLQYVLMFMLGALLAKNRAWFYERYNSLWSISKVLLGIFGILCYTFAWWKKHIFINLPLSDDWVISIGAIIFIVLAFSSRTTTNLLLIKPIHFIGKISYSIYLYHCIVLFGLIHLLSNMVPYLLIVLISVVLTLIISTLSYNYVEVPSIKLGRSLTSRIQKNKYKNKTISHQV